VFYYALVAVDEAGNTSPISNIVSLYIQEKHTMKPTTISPTAHVTKEGEGMTSLLSARGLHNFIYNLSLGPTKIFYLAAVIGAILVLLILTLFAAIIIRMKMVKKRHRCTNYNANDKDTYCDYEPATVVVRRQEKEKNLTNWLDSLPRSMVDDDSSRPNTSISFDQQQQQQQQNQQKHQQAPTTLPRSTKQNCNGSGSINNHTLTKTNPYRHKMLTNGSFLNLKDISNCNVTTVVSSGVSSSSNEDTSRPTTSTEDNRSSSSQPSSESGEYQRHQAPLVASPGGGHIIDMSTARAIIDTYSGNLFSSASSIISAGPAYYSFCQDSMGEPIHSPSQHKHAILHQQMSVEVGQDNLECVHRSLANYPHVVPTMAKLYYDGSGNNDVHNAQMTTRSTVAKVPPPVRPRTESVV